METKNIVKYKEKIEKLKIDDYAPSIRMSEDEFTEDYLASVRRRINQQQEVHDSRIKKLRGLYYAGEETQNLQISRDMYALVEEDTVEVKSSPIGAMSQKAVDKAFRDLAFDKLYSEVDAMSLCLDKYIEEADGFAQSRVERVTLDEYVVRNYKYISVCEDFVNKLDGYRLNAEQEESLEKLRSKVKALKDASEPIYAGQAETITDVSEERASSVKELDKLILRKCMEGATDNEGIIFNLLNRPYQERLFIYSIIEKGDLETTNILSCMKAFNNYVPDSDVIMEALLPKKRFRSSRKFDLEKISKAVRLADNFRNEINLVTGAIDGSAGDDDLSTAVLEALSLAAKQDELIKQSKANTSKLARKKFNDALAKNSDKLKLAMEDLAKTYAVKSGLKAEQGLKGLKAWDAEIADVTALTGKEKLGLTATKSTLGAIGIVAGQFDNAIFGTVKGISGALNSGVGLVLGGASSVLALCSIYSLVRNFNNITNFEKLISAGGIASNAASASGSFVSFASATTKTLAGKAATEAGTKVSNAIGIMGTISGAATIIAGGITAGSGMVDMAEYMLHSRSKREEAKYNFAKAEVDREYITDDTAYKTRMKNYEAGMVKLSEQISHRRMMQDGLNVATGLMSAGAGLANFVMSPGMAQIASLGLATASLLTGFIGKKIIASRIGAHIGETIDDFLGLDSVIATRHRDGKFKEELTDKRRSELKKILRKELMAKEGYVNEKEYYAHILHVYAGLIRKGIYPPDTAIDEKHLSNLQKAYIDLAKSLKLKVDFKRNLPTEQMIFKKLNS